MKLYPLEIHESDDRIWLHLECGPDGMALIRDQEGRQLGGIKSIGYRRAAGELVEISLVVVSGVKKNG